MTSVSVYVCVRVYGGGHEIKRKSFEIPNIKKRLHVPVASRSVHCHRTI